MSPVHAGLVDVSVYSADQVCKAVEAVLEEHLDTTTAALGFTALAAPSSRAKAVRDWQQLPDPDSVSSAKLPAGTVSSAGIMSSPPRKSGKYHVTWLVEVGIYDRGKSHDDTQKRIRDWCAAIRMTVLSHPSLKGIAVSTSWTAEQYAQMSGVTVARTFGAGVVGFEVTVEVPTIVTVGAGGQPLPVATTASTDFSIK